MDRKYISESRYKKTTREKANREKFGIKLKKSPKSRIKKKTKKQIKIIILIILIIIFSAIMHKYEVSRKNTNENFVKTEDGKLKPINTSKITLAANINDGIGSPLLSKNLYVTELNKYVYTYFLKIDNEYNIKYEAIKKVIKKSNKEYELKINNKIVYDLERKISVHDIKNSIEQLQILGDKSVYYNYVKAIEKVEVIDEETLKVILREDNSLFIYNLQLPVLPINKYNDSTKISEDLAPQELGNIYNVYQNESNIVYERSKYASKAYLERINIIKVSKVEDIVQKFKDNEVDAFFTTRVNIENDLGKYEYNQKYYSTGQSVFLFANNSSEKAKIKEARVALSYLIDKQEIKKEVYNSMAMPIDVPYISYQDKYRYDKIAAKNTLTSAGFEKVDGIYSKDKLSLTFRLLVNINNNELYKIAKIIKNDMAEAGIRIELVEVDNSSYGTFLNSKNYDLALMQVNLNENIDVTFIERYMIASEELRKIDVKLSEETNIEKIEELFKQRIKVMQDEALCIGIISETTCMISKKYVSGFEEISYQNVFKKLQDISLTKN